MRRKNITSGVSLRNPQRSGAGGNVRTSGVALYSQTPVGKISHRPVDKGDIATAWKWNDNDTILWNSGEVMTYA